MTPRRWNKCIHIMLLLAIAFVVGCGSSKEGPAPVATTPSSGRVTLTIGIPAGSDEAVQAQQRLNEQLRTDPLLADVAVETVAVSPLIVSTIDDFAAGVLTEGGPDIIVTTPLMAGYLSILDAIQPLNDSLPKHVGLGGRWAALYAGAQQAVTFEGTIMGAPRTMDLTGMVYHREYMETAGIEIDPHWDWNDMAAVSSQLRPTVLEAVNAGDDGYLQLMLRQSSSRLQPVSLCFRPQCWLPFVWSNGGEYINRTTYEPEFNSFANEQTFGWLQQHAESRHIGFDGGLIFFAQGGAAMAPGTYSAAMTEGSVYGVAPWPRSPYTGRAVTMMSVSMYAVNPHTANMPVVLDFLAASLSAAGQTAAAQALSALPVRDDAAIPRFAGLPPDDAIRRAAADARPDYITGLENMFPIQPMEMEAMLFGQLSVSTFLHDVEQEVRLSRLTQEDFWWRKLATPGPAENFFGGSDAPRRPTDQEPPSAAWEKNKGVEIMFLANTPELMDLIEEFNRSQDDIYVRFATRVKNTNYDETMTAGLAAGDYDVLWLAVPRDMRAELMESGALLPLDRLLAATPVDTRDDGGMINASRGPDGTLYMIPMQRSTTFIIARKEAWERSGWSYPTDGWTWAEYLQWAREVHEPDARSYGALVAAEDWSIIAQQREPDMTMYPYGEMAADLELFRQLHELFPADEPSLPGGTYGHVAEGTALSGVSHSLYLDRIVSEGNTHPIILLPLPAPEGGMAGSIGWGNDYVAIAADTDYPQQAFAFIAWLIEQNERVTLHPDRNFPGQLPLRLTPEAMDALEARFGPHIRHVVVNPVQHADAVADELARDMREAVGPFLQGQTTVEEALRQVEQTAARYAP